VSEHGMWGYPEFYIPVPGGYGDPSTLLTRHWDERGSPMLRPDASLSGLEAEPEAA